MYDHAKHIFMSLNFDCVIHILKFCDLCSLRRCAKTCRQWNCASSTTRKQRAFQYFRAVIRKYLATRGHNIRRLGYDSSAPGRWKTETKTPVANLRHRCFEITKESDFLTSIQVQGTNIRKIVIRVNGIDYQRSYHLGVDRAHLKIDEWLPLRYLHWCRVFAEVQASNVVNCRAEFCSREGRVEVIKEPTNEPSSLIIDKLVWIRRNSLSNKVLLSSGFMTVL